MAITFRIRSKIRHLRSDEDGLSAVEFALIAPVLCVLLLGAMDMAHALYMTSVVQGSLQKAGRDASLETGTENARQQEIDDAVTTQVKKLATNANVVLTRRYYTNFTKANAAIGETFTDTNGNGVCDAGEPYQDTNNNSTRDADGGDAGQGGAKDTVVYTATVTYGRLFPMSSLIGLSPNMTINATTVLANQPYGEQAQYGAATVRNCV